MTAQPNFTITNFTIDTDTLEPYAAGMVEVGGIAFTFEWDMGLGVYGVDYEAEIIVTEDDEAYQRGNKIVPVDDVRDALQAVESAMYTTAHRATEAAYDAAWNTYRAAWPTPTA